MGAVNGDAENGEHREFARRASAIVKREEYSINHYYQHKQLKVVKIQLKIM